MTKRLPDPLAADVARLIEEAEAFVDEGADDEALVLFQSAWGLLPEPKGGWEEAEGLLFAMADCHFYLGSFESCLGEMQQALRECGSEPDNPFVRLRVGQCFLELEKSDEARNWLVPVYLLEGVAAFEGEDPKYLAFAREGLEPPEGGWPEGW